ncbi:origin recognition complex subunit 1 [Diutina catenulata]
MARREKDLTGWSFKLHEAPANSPRKRASRRVNSTPTPSGDRITMTRDSDDMTIGVGDVVQLVSGDHCLIIDIALGINNFLELTVARLTSGEDGELVLTPTIEVLNDVQHVHSKKSVGTSGKSNDFRVTHAIDPEVNNRHKFTWTERIERLLSAGKQDFIEWIRSVTAAKPTKRKESVTSTPTKKPTYVFSSASEDDDSGDEFKSAEEDNHDTEDEDVKLSEDEEEAKPSAPATPRKRGRPASASPRKNARKEKPAAEDDAFHFMEAVLSPSKSKKKSFKTMRTPQKANKGKLDLSMLSPSKKQQKSEVPASNMELDKDSEAFKQLKAKLEAGAVFDMVVGREDEFMTIMMNIQDGVSSGEGCCIYISGTPGTGKTATIRHVISALQQEAAEGLLPEFDFYEACGLRMISATYVYEMLWEQLTGYKVSPTNASTLLDEYFRRGKAPRPLVVFLDELDSMVSSKQEVLYNLLNWPTYPGSKLIVVAAANTMDLPERMLANKVSSRLGLRRMQFPGYTFSQLEDIFNHRLQSLATEASSEGAAQVVIQPQALEFAARKVASVAGDARKALGIARRAVELCLADLRASNNSIENHPLTMNHIMRAISQFNQASSPQPFLKSLPFASKLLLAAMVSCTKRSSLAELLLRDVIVEMYNMVQLMTSKHATAPFRAIESSSNYLELLYGNLKFYYDGEGAPKEVENIRVSQFAYIVKELCECGIVAASDHGAELYKKIRFNLHRDEVEKALASDDEVSALIK